MSPERRLIRPAFTPADDGQQKTTPETCALFTQPPRGFSVFFVVGFLDPGFDSKGPVRPMQAFRTDILTCFFVKHVATGIPGTLKHGLQHLKRGGAEHADSILSDLRASAFLPVPPYCHQRGIDESSM